jgi:hypothetical protein
MMNMHNAYRNMPVVAVSKSPIRLSVKQLPNAAPEQKNKRNVESRPEAMNVLRETRKYVSLASLPMNVPDSSTPQKFISMVAMPKIVKTLKKPLNLQPIRLR